MQRLLCACTVHSWLLALTAKIVFRHTFAEIISYSGKENEVEDSNFEFTPEKKLDFPSFNKTVYVRKYKDLSRWENPHFDYDASHGPRLWGHMYPPCMGELQSPVNLDTSTATSIHSPRLLWWGYALKPATMTLSNNGHTVMLTATWDSADEVPYIWTSPGDQLYSFAQLHFHWGSDDVTGSEHTVNKERFPLELHVVHYLHSLGSLKNALHYEAGVRVVGLFYRLSEESNPALDDVISWLPRVLEAGSSVSLQPFPLASLLHTFSRHYLAYNGSLTTPPCLEVVQWVLSTDPHQVSQRQVPSDPDGNGAHKMAAFRSLLNPKGSPIVENYRPLQPLNNRQVLHIR